VLLLFEVLADLFRPKGANPIQSEAEDYPVLFSQTNVETRELSGHRTTVPGVAQRQR
jgi:hypothetical protein